VGGHAFRVRATDPSGNVDPSPAESDWTLDQSANLLPNGSFDSGTSGWQLWNDTLAQAGDGRVGAAAGRVRLTTSDRFGIISSPRPVSSSVAGAVYALNGFLRSDAPGKAVCFRIREWSGGVNTGLKEVCPAATANWQAIPPVSYVAAGGTQLDVVVVQYNATGGDSFEVDGLSLTSGKK
jgi:hypothetical protein